MEDSQNLLKFLYGKASLGKGARLTFDQACF